MDIAPEKTPFEVIGPNTITPDHVRGLSLSRVTQEYGTLGLYTRLQATLAERGLDQVPEITWALQMGLTLHANDNRTNGPYNDHLLRVTLRSIEDYGIDDPALIAAHPLHDSIEDHPKDLVLALTGNRMTDVGEARTVGVELLARHTYVETAEIVVAVTNPLLAEGDDKQAVYASHTEELVLTHPKGRVLKLSDFVENAVGNHYTLGSKRDALDEKYLDLFRIHRMGLFMPDSLITGELRLKVLAQLSAGHARAQARLNTPAKLGETLLQS